MNQRLDILRAGPLAQAPQDLIDDIPPDVIDQIPDSVIDQLRDGVIDKIPDDIVDQLPTSVTDRIPDGLLESASANPVLAGILIVVGVLALIVFVFGIVKSAIKAAVFGGVLAAAAWYWYFQIQ